MKFLNAENYEEVLQSFYTEDIEKKVSEIVRKSINKSLEEWTISIIGGIIVVSDEVNEDVCCISPWKLAQECIKNHNPKDSKDVDYMIDLANELESIAKEIKKLYKK